MASISQNHTSMFAQRAKVGDYILLNMHQNGRYSIYPPRKILFKEDADSQRVFYMEKSSEHIKQIIDFDKFIIKLRGINKDIPISKSSIRKIANKHISGFNSVWQSG